MIEDHKAHDANEELLLSCCWWHLGCITHVAIKIDGREEDAFNGLGNLLLMC